jgi:hypothetical protein
MDVVYDIEYACFEYRIKGMSNKIHPFAEHDELKTDVLDYCEVIEG